MPAHHAIRPATIADHAAIVEICIPLQESHAAAQPWRFRTGGSPLPAPYVRGLLEDDASAIFVSVHGDAVTGFVILKRVDTPPIDILTPRRYVLVDTIAVAPAWQGHGIGHGLLEIAEAWAREQGAADLDLSVAAFNDRAITFYRRHGFGIRNLVMTKRLETMGDDGVS